MTAYECTGRLSHNGLTVERWAPRPSDAAKLRRHLSLTHATDHGLPDATLTAIVAEAKAYVGGRRLSWTVIAADMIRRAAAGPASTSG